MSCRICARGWRKPGGQTSLTCPTSVLGWDCRSSMRGRSSSPTGRREVAAGGARQRSAAVQDRDQRSGHSLRAHQTRALIGSSAAGGHERRAGLLARTSGCDTCTGGQDRDECLPAAKLLTTSSGTSRAFHLVLLAGARGCSRCRSPCHGCTAARSSSSHSEALIRLVPNRAVACRMRPSRGTRTREAGARFIEQMHRRGVAARGVSCKAATGAA